MAGFAAILTRGDPRVAAARLPTTLAAAAHRGAPAGSVTSGRTALGVLETPGLADASSASRDGWVAVFAGHLDNLAELLEPPVHAGGAGAATPAEVVLTLVRADGPAALVRLRGVFAGAVSDGERLWTFRDHVGLCPAFFHDGDDAFVAASEPKQVLAGANLPRRPDLDALEQIFYGRTSDSTPSALAGVRRLPKASWAAAAARSDVQIERYWHPERLLETASLTPHQVDDRFRELFAQAVARSLGPRTTISLSGGIDSPAVAAFAAMAAPANGRPLGALSAVFPDLPSVDESGYIQLVAGRLGLDLHTYRPTARALDNLATWGELMDGPVLTVSVPELDENYALAHRLGYDTILTGELAEFVIDHRRHLLGHLAVHGRLRPALRVVRSQRGRGVGRKQILRQLAAPLVPRRLMLWYATRTPDARPTMPAWLDPKMIDDAAYHDDLRVPGRRRWLDQQLRAFPGPGITIEADEVCQSLNGVVVRRPFADVDLWEFFLSLPAQLKFPDASSKTLVRNNLRGLVPDEILDRRDKTAFNDHMIASADYDPYERFLVGPRHRIRGVDYGLLADRIAARAFSFYDHVWARDLAAVHAFLDQW